MGHPSKILVMGSVAYLLGTIPFGILISRAFGSDDPRQKGSGNIGATNVARVAGVKAGILTLALDAGKASLAVSLPLAFGLGRGLALACALLVVLGHMFPVWTGLRGGKGIASILGATLVLSPAVAAAGLVAFVLVVWLTRYVSLGSLLALLSGFAASWLMAPSDSGLKVILFAFFLLGAIKHAPNIRRLANGCEPKFRTGSRA